MNKTNVWLSTKDNPYNPFSQFNQWLMFDIEKGYDCCGKLARVVRLSDNFTDKEVDEETERAINEIIKYDILDIYVKKIRNPD